MPDIARRPHLLAALSLALPLLAAAQAAQTASPSQVPERALRDAERVLSIIKFHAVRPRPADKPRRPATTAGTRPAEGGASGAAVAVAAAASAPLPTPAAEPPPASVVAATLAEPPVPAAAPVTTAATVAVDDDAPDEPQEVALHLRHFVAPVLTPSVQAMLGAGARRVSVRFTVATDGTVTQAQAAADVPPRLARPATEAVLQWQFKPLPHPRTVDVELALRRE
jgi:hypothetical protein